MTDKRRIYLRRKGKGHWILEGKRNRKTIYLWTLPSLEIFVKEILAKSSYLTKEKIQKLLKNYECLDHKA